MSLMYYSIALINPSYSEGWSNTVEQAKAMKKKTIISNIKVHKEQKNKNTILFNPTDYKKLKKILDEEYLRNLKIKKKYDKNYFNSNIQQRKNFTNNYQNLLFKYL